MSDFNKKAGEQQSTSFEKLKEKFEWLRDQYAGKGLFDNIVELFPCASSDQKYLFDREAEIAIGHARVILNDVIDFLESNNITEDQVKYIIDIVMKIDSFIIKSGSEIEKVIGQERYEKMTNLLDSNLPEALQAMIGAPKSTLEPE